MTRRARWEATSAAELVSRATPSTTLPLYAGSLLRDEEEKAKIQRDLTKMTERLARLNEDLARKMQARVEFDQTIQETEAAYMKILESSSTYVFSQRTPAVSAIVSSTHTPLTPTYANRLLGVLKRESTNLKKTATSSRP